ncbi:unnamed protein product [Pedinophyceae sp. YPF-701]|nr:unnamed protein product [Pedinophyceae sp. YPF-701]
MSRLLCRHAGTVLGVSCVSTGAAAGSDSSALVTVEGDGVISYAGAYAEAERAWAAGRAQLVCAAQPDSDGEGIWVGVRGVTGKVDLARARRDASGTTLATADASPMPGLMCLHPAPQGVPGVVALASDGTAHLVSGTDGVVHSSEPPGRAGNVQGSASAGPGRLVYVENHSKEGLRAWRISVADGGDVLERHGPFAIGAAPAPAATPAAIASEDGETLAVLWSTGHLRLHGLTEGRHTTDIGAPVFEVALRGLRTPDGNPPAASGRGKKRAQAASAAPSASLSMAALGGGYYAVAGQTNTDAAAPLAPNKAILAVLDLKFGAVHALKRFEEEIDGKLEGLQVTGLTAAQVDGHRGVLATLGGAVVAVPLPLPPLSLAAVAQLRRSGADATALIVGAGDDSASRPALVAWRAVLGTATPAAGTDGAAALLVAAPRDRLAFDEREAAEGSIAKGIAALQGAKTAAGVVKAAGALAEAHEASDAPWSQHAVASLAARCAAVGGGWGALRGVLEKATPGTLACPPGAVSELLAAGDALTLVHLILAAAHVPAGDLSLVLRACLPDSGAVSDALAAGLREAAAASAAAAQQIVADAEARPTATTVRGAALAAAAIAVAPRCGYAAPLLHAAIALRPDPASTIEALQRLPLAPTIDLLRYLLTWLEAYHRRPSLTNSDKGGTRLTPPLAAPSLGTVLEWANLTVDANFARLATHRDASDMLRRMQDVVGALSGASRSLGRLQGVVEHVQLHAPLPAGAGTAASLYSVELIDLSVGKGP